MTKTITIAMLLTALTSAGCKKKGGGGSAAAKGRELPESVMEWTPPGAQKALEGAWKARMTLAANMGGSHSMAGDPVALDIKAETATAFDGKTEVQMSWVIESPCTARFDEALTEGSMKGGTAYHEVQFVLKDGKALLGDGGVGFKKGNAWVFCVGGMDSDGIYIQEDKAKPCTRWGEKFGKWEQSEGVCKWDTADGKERLTVGTGDWATKLYVEGDLLMTEQFQEATKLYEKVGDFATAKQAVVAKNKADDPGERAKASGGKVGDKSTVLGLIATYAADKSLKGQTVELTAEFLNSNHSWSGDKHFYNAIVVDNKDTTKLTLACHTKEEVTGFTQFDKVVVKGTIDESFDKPSLKDCTITKAP